MAFVDGMVPSSFKDTDDDVSLKDLTVQRLSDRIMIKRCIDNNHQLIPVYSCKKCNQVVCL